MLYKASPLAKPKPEAKVVCASSGAISMILPGSCSVTNKSPALSKTNASPPVNPDAKVLFTPAGVNS